MDGVISLVYDKKGGNKILMVKRRDVPVWTIPGGGVEDNELLIDAAIREAKEESGYDIKIVKKVAEYYSKDKTKINHLYEGYVVGGGPKINEEASEIAFFRPSRLPEIVNPRIIDWIKDTKRNSNVVIKSEFKQISIFELLKNSINHPQLVFRFILKKIGLTINA